MKSSRPRSRIVPGITWGAVLLTLLSTNGAFAQSDDEVDPFAPDSSGDESTPDETEPTEEAPADESSYADSDSNGTDSDGTVESENSGSVQVEASTELNFRGDGMAPAAAVSEVPEEQKNIYRSQGLWQALRHDDNRFGIDGGLQMDLGYSDYRQSIETEGPEVLHDFRGQFWVAPVLEHRFLKNKDGFVRVSAELVAWLREEVNLYQVNLFDVYAQAGIEDVFDFQIGRLTTWRMVNVGNGYDIFTLEDTGPVEVNDFAAGQFYPFRYEVDYVWLRDAPGRASLHFYPLKKFVPADWNNLGIELTGQYGTRGKQNLDGARATVIYDQKWVRVAGAAEYETQKNTKDQVSASDLTLCEQCTWQYRRGYGASVTVRPPYVVAAVNHSDGFTVNKGPRGEAGEEGRGEITTQSGFIELHTGHLLASAKDGPRPDLWADQRSENIRKLTVGFGGRRTEQLFGNNDFWRVDSRVAYIKYNFGFNESSIKFVGTYGEGTTLDNTRAISETPRYLRRDGDQLAGRIRFAYYW